MSLYNEASLVMVPSAYKDQKVYSVKPFDGTGDLTFTRSNDTASRVASDGLIQKVRTNVFSFSEDFSTSSGFFAGVTGASTATFTANYGTAPDGTATADRIQLELNGEPYADWLRPFAVTTGVGYTYSIYLKSLSGTPTIEFLNDGSVGIQKTLTTDWVRYDYTWTSAGATIYPRFLLGAATSSSADILAWGAMVEVSDFGPTDYIATTSAAVSVGPVANLPRLDYSGGATCPKLLLEGQRTNAITFSESFDNAAWTKGGDVILTANYATSPDGYQNADRVVADTSSSGHIVYRSITTTGTHTISIFAKASGYNYTFFGYDGGNLTFGIVFNLSNGTISQNPSGLTGTIEAVGSDGWYRCTLTFNAPASRYFVVSPHDNSGSYNWTGNGTDGILIYGAQAELLSSYATSYIPTLSAAVTRGADDVSDSTFTALPNANFTIFFEVNEWSGSDGNNYQVRFFDASGNRDIQFRNRPEGWRWLIVNDAGGSAYLNTPSYTFTKMACRYNGTNYQLFADGSAFGAPFAASDSGILDYFDSYPIGVMGIKQMLCFPTALSDTDCETLTTL
jgi:hypothetical protein